MGVLAVTESVLFLEADELGARESVLFALGAQPAGDGSIVGGRMSEDFGGQPLASLGGDIAFATLDFG